MIEYKTEHFGKSCVVSKKHVNEYNITFYLRSGKEISMVFTTYGNIESVDETIMKLKDGDIIAGYEPGKYGEIAVRVKGGAIEAFKVHQINKN